jgi:hypothetical protein
LEGVDGVDSGWPWVGGGSGGKGVDVIYGWHRCIDGWIHTPAPTPTPASTIHGNPWTHGWVGPWARIHERIHARLHSNGCIRAHPGSWQLARVDMNPWASMVMEALVDGGGW